MPSPPRVQHPAVKSPLRYCLSCTVTIACWAAWLALGALLGALAYVALARELPVPDFVLRRVEARLADANLRLHFERVRFDPSGRLLLEGLELHAPRFEEPLLAARLAYVQGSFWGWLAGLAIPDEIRLEGASLQLPAMLSPDGTAQPLIDDLAATLRHEDGQWRVQQLVFRAGRLEVTGSGQFRLPRRADAPDWTLGEVVRHYLQAARPAAASLAALDACDRPALTVQLESPPGLGNTAHLAFTATEIRLPGAARLHEVRATTVVRLDGAAARPLRVFLDAQRVQSGDTRATGVHAELLARLTPAGLRVEPQEIWASAARLEAAGEVLGAPLGHARLDAWPRLRLDVAFLAGAAPLSVQAEAALDDKSARLRLAGRGDPAFVNDLLHRRTPRFAPWLVLGDPVAGAAELDLAPGWKLGSLTADVTGGRIDSRGVAIDALAGRLEFDGHEFLARDAYLRAGANTARGSYWMNVRSRDYRILLTGALRPLDIGGWFQRPWWSNLWGNFEFPVTPPDADVDLSGRWTEPRLSANFISADAAGARIRGVDFDRVRTRVFVRPRFLDGLTLDAVRAGGAQALRGTYERTDDPTDREPPQLGFNVTSTLDPAVFDPLLRGAAAPLLADWRFRQHPRLDLTGSWSERTGGGTANLTFRGRAEGGLHYRGFPLDTLDVEGGVSGPDLRLDRINFTVAGGTGRGKASLAGPPDARRLGFDVYVHDADLGPAVRAVQEFDAARTGEPSKPGADSKFLQRAAAAKLQLALSANGVPGEFDSFRGSGNARLTGATLSEIHLFGLLSQVLSGLTLKFSTLKLDTIHGSFDLADGRVHFPDLRVTGDSAIIDARGGYTFASNRLDFVARFKPYGENRNILTGTLGLVLNPLTSIIELKLAGPLGQPTWSYTLGQSPTETRTPPPPEAARPGG